MKGKVPVMDGSVALLPLTFKWRLDFSSPPSITLHLTVSAVFDITDNDIIPPKRYQRTYVIPDDMQELILTD